MKHFIGIVLILLTGLSTMQAQMAQIQFIHNAPDVSISDVDIYVNDILVVDDLAFKSGTAFLDIPITDEGTNELVFTSAMNADVIYLETLQELNEDETYYAVLDGIFNTAQYPGIEELAVYFTSVARTEATVAEDTDLDIIVHNGALGFDNELEVDGTQILASPLPMAKTIALGDYSDLNDDGYTLWISDTFMFIEIIDYSLAMGDESTDFYYRENIDFGEAGFPDYSDQAIILLITGFKNPSDFENGEPFDAYLLGPDGGNFQPLLGVSDTAQELSVHIVPNPVESNLNIVSTTPYTSYTLFDIQGRLIAQADFSAHKTKSVFIEAYPSGVYFLMVSNAIDNTSVTKRIIKK